MPGTVRQQCATEPADFAQSSRSHSSRSSSFRRTGSSPSGALSSAPARSDALLRGSWLQAFGPDRSAWYSGALQITIAFGQGGMSIGFTGDSVEYTIVRYVTFWALLGAPCRRDGR